VEFVLRLDRVLYDAVFMLMVLMVRGWSHGVQGPDLFGFVVACVYSWYRDI
jgi:hypothetical protein